jgi:uncharacterized delta-60 repeat protein
MTTALRSIFSKKREADHGCQMKPFLHVPMKLFSFPERFSRLSLVWGVALPLLAAATLRAQAPGDQDTSFATGPAADGSLFALALQPNGQVLVGGAFTAFRAATRIAVARLNPDGSLDSFNPGLALSGYNGGTAAVRALGLQANGQIIAAGIFNVLGQKAGGGVARLNADGSLDATFNVGTGIMDNGGTVGQAEAVAVLSNGQILVGGAFSSFNEAKVAGLVRLNADGSLDTSFNPGGAGITSNGHGGDVKAIAVQPDGKILIGGGFSAYNGAAAGGIARLNANGTFDASFDPGSGVDYAVEAIALQADGRILVGGDFNTFNGADLSKTHLVRVNADGGLDTGYYPVSGVNLNEVAAVLVQPDGSALVGGVVRIPQGLIASTGDGLARINADGTQDTDFNSGGGPLRVTALALQSDGKALLAGNYDALVGAAVGDVYRVYDLTISSTPAVTLTAGIPTVAAGSGQRGEFLLTLSAARDSDLIVNYTVKGTAINGTDYAPLKGALKIKAGKTSKVIKVIPQGDLGGAAKKAVTLALTPGDGYTVGIPSKAKVKIFGQ